LFLRLIADDVDNELTVVVQEAILGDKGSEPEEDYDIPGLKEVLKGSRPIISDETCFFYQLYWPSYIAYHVSNESYANADPKEKFSGKFLRKYSNSTYLDFLSKATFASQDYPGPFAHWGVITESHIIDVASVDAPKITRIKEMEA